MQGGEKIKKFLKGTSYILVMIFFSFALSGCSLTSTKKPAATTTPVNNDFVVWSFEDADVWKPIKTSFEGTNKGLSFKYQKQTLDENYENRLLNSILAGQGPDVFAMPNDWVYRHKEKLYPAPIDAKTKSTGITLDDSFAPAVKQSIYFNNQIYGLTPFLEPLIVYYNSKLFEEALENFNQTHKGEENAEARKKAASLLEAPPTSWSNFIEASKLLTKKDANNNITQSGVALGTANIDKSQDILYLLMLQNETRIISEDLKIATFNLPKDNAANSTNIPGKRALDFYTSFATPSSPSYSWNDSLGNNIEAFVNGKTAMIFGYSSLQKTFLTKYPNFRYRKAYAPQISQEQYSVIDFAKFNVFSVSKVSKNPGIAWNLVKKISSEQSDTFIEANKSYSSALVKNAERDGASNSPERGESFSAKAVIKGRYPIDFDNTLKSAITAVNKGVQDSKAALDLSAVNITDLLKKEIW